MTRLNKGFSLVTRKRHEKNLDSLDVGTTSPYLPSLLRDQTQPWLFSREKEEAGNKFWSPWASGQFPHPSPPYCLTRLNQGYCFVRRKKQENSLESLGVGTTAPPLPSLLRGQIQPGLFSREKEEAGAKFGVPGRLDNFPTPSLPAV